MRQHLTTNNESSVINSRMITSTTIPTIMWRTRDRVVDRCDAVVLVGETVVTSVAEVVMMAKIGGSIDAGSHLRLLANQVRLARHRQDSSYLLKL